VKWFAFGQEATGVIAIGQLATGVIAIGQVATGVIAIGQGARGVVAVGQLAIGAVATGQIGVGVLYGAGMLGLGTFAGGLIPVPLMGTLGLDDVLHLRFRRRQRGPRIGAGRLAYIAAVLALVTWAVMLPLWGALFDVGGIFYQTPPRR
jgi:hypothetical protein